jgi:hypothetical protein
MNGAFGRGDWVANGRLFTGYHLHVSWGMPATRLDTFVLAYPTKRFRSAWIGIAVHSAQSVVLAILISSSDTLDAGEARGSRSTAAACRGLYADAALAIAYALRTARRSITVVSRPACPYVERQRMLAPPAGAFSSVTVDR